MKNYHKCKVKATSEKYSIKVITRINPLGNTEVRWFCKKNDQNEKSVQIYQ